MRKKIRKTRYHVYIPEAMIDVLKQIEAETDYSPSAIMTAALREYVARHHMAEVALALNDENANDLNKLWGS